MNRRQILKWSAGAVCGGLAFGGVYPLLEAKWCRVLRVRLGVPNLPGMFEGLRLAFVADVHHGPHVPLGYVRHVVEMVNALKPDLIALGGDYVSKSRSFIAPAVDVLGGLRAPLGRFAVLGNHDHWEDGPATSAALAAAGITEVTNAGEWIERRFEIANLRRGRPLDRFPGPPRGARRRGRNGRRGLALAQPGLCRIVDRPAGRAGAERPHARRPGGGAGIRGAGGAVALRAEVQSGAGARPGRPRLRDPGRGHLRPPRAAASVGRRSSSSP